MDERHVDRLDHRSVRGGQETVVDALHVRRAEDHVRGQILDQRARRRGGAGENDFPDLQPGHRSGGLFRLEQRSDLREDLARLPRHDRQPGVSLRIRRDDLFEAAGDDRDRRVSRAHRVDLGVLEHVIGAARVHRLGEHETTERCGIRRPAHDEAGLVWLAVRGSGDEVLALFVLIGVQPVTGRQRLHRLVRGPGPGDEIGDGRQGNGGRRLRQVDDGRGAASAALAAARTRRCARSLRHRHGGQQRQRAAGGGESCDETAACVHCLLLRLCWIGRCGAHGVPSLPRMSTVRFDGPLPQFDDHHREHRAHRD